MDKIKLQKPVDVNKKLQEVADKTPIDAAKGLVGLKATNSTVPSYTPKSFLEQIYLYKNDTDYRLYIYLNNEWKYIDFTA